MSTAGVKHDSSKVRTDLLPPDALWAVSEVMTDGAAKYGDRNWERGMAWGRLLGASLRHLFAWAMGENLDRETGRPHLAHAACCVLFLLSYQLRGIGVDDRPAGLHCPGQVDDRQSSLPGLRVVAGPS